MIELKDLLSHFTKILLTESAKRDLFIQALKEVVGLEVDKKDIKIKNKTVYLNIKPIYKNQIFLKKEKLNERFIELGGKENFKVL